jgi:dinuclear metal center YbgI/SA1388 family protein
MLLSEITAGLEAFAPLCLAEEWDNTGLMLGDPSAEITSAAAVLDVTDEVVDFAVKNGCGLIVSHHPFIMNMPKNMAFTTPLQKNIVKLIKNNISVYSMHTNFDSCVGGINNILCELLELTGYASNEPRTVWNGKLKEPAPLSGFIEKVKKTFNIEKVIFSGPVDKLISKVAVCGGGGGNFISEAAEIADVYLTGEVKYHDFQYGLSLGLPIVTAGHFETENICMFKISGMLQNMGLTVLDAGIHNGFCRFG